MQDSVQEDSTDTYGDIYTEIATDCIRYLDLTIEEIDRLTMPEITLLMNAQRLKDIDKYRDMHLQAWLNVSAGATKKDGKPVYKKFKDFFDYDKEVGRMNKKPDNKFSNLSKHLKEKEKCRTK